MAPDQLERERAGIVRRNRVSLLIAVVIACLPPRTGLAAERDLCSPDGVAQVTLSRERATLRSACELGQWKACVQAANSYLHGETRSDVTTAGNLYARACDGGSPDACLALGGLQAAGLLDDPGGGQDAYRRASDLYRDACELEHPAACLGLAQMLRARQVILSEARSVMALRARALSLYEAQCAAGSDEACAGLGTFYLAGDPGERQEQRAVEAFQRACDLGEPSSCSYLGGAFLHGDSGQVRDLTAAANFFSRACEAGDVSSCALAADLHLQQVPSQWSVAARLYERACNSGIADACYALAQAYEKGWISGLDSRNALHYLTQACSAGCREACRPPR